MAPSKTTSGSNKKRTQKTNSRFYIVKTVQQAQTSLAGTLDGYQRRYVTQPLRQGMAFVQDLKAEPRQSVVNLFDDGKERIADLNKEVWTRVEDLARDGQAFLTKAGKNPRGVLDELMDDGKELVEDLRSNTSEKLEDLVVDFKIFKEGVEKDTRQVMTDVLDGGKKALDRVPGRQMIENEISSRMQEIPARLNLPSRKDIERLSRQVKSLNTKVNKLSKPQAV